VFELVRKGKAGEGKCAHCYGNGMNGERQQASSGCYELAAYKFVDLHGRYH
jgi:hypothetical protein